MVRKVGGFTFQELNLAIDDIKDTSAVGPDLSYDFVTRPAYQFAMCTADTEFLRLTLREALALGVDQASLVHALQNHDELTYELVHFAARHRDDLYTLGGVEYTGVTLAEHVRETMRQVLTGDAAPYNAVFVQNGIACTTASVIAASLGISDLADDHRLPTCAGSRTRTCCCACTTPGSPASSRFRLGPGGRLPPRPRQGARADRQRRHPLDRARRLRPDGQPAGRQAVLLRARRSRRRSTGRCRSS